MRVFEGYERRKRRHGPDRLRGHAGARGAAVPRSIREAAAEVRGRYRAFTVDEYQDVNPLQQALLDAWLGGRDDVCVVGDDYQTIYALHRRHPRRTCSGFPDRYPAARVVRLEENYRSTPADPGGRQPLDAYAGRIRARRFAPLARRAQTRRRRAFPATDGRGRVRRGEVRRLARGEGTPSRRSPSCTGSTPAPSSTRRRSRPPGIPYQVRDGSFLRRPGPRRFSRRSRRTPAPVVEAVEDARDAWATIPDRARRRTKRSRGRRTSGGCGAGARVRRARPDGDVRPSWPSSPPLRGGATGRGVNLLTLHRAKGLEFDAVFLPRLAGRRAPLQARPRGGRPRRGAPAALRRHHPRPSPPVPVVATRREDDAEPVPAGARSVPILGPARA